jgi:hypothetical protein
MRVSDLQLRSMCHSDTAGHGHGADTCHLPPNDSLACGTRLGARFLMGQFDPKPSLMGKRSAGTRIPAARSPGYQGFVAAGNRHSTASRCGQPQVQVTGGIVNFALTYRVGHRQRSAKPALQQPAVAASETQWWRTELSLCAGSAGNRQTYFRRPCGCAPPDGDCRCIVV